MEIEDLYCIADFDDYRAIYNRPEREEADKIYKETNDLKKVQEFCKSIRRKDYAIKLKAKANMAKKFSKRTFETFNIENPIQKKAYNQARQYAENIEKMLEDGTNLIICGNCCVGTGKTHLVYSVANYILDNGVPAEVYNTVDLVDSLKEFDFKTKDHIKNVEVLIIDDITKAYGTGWLASELYGILNTRYENEKPTILTIEEDIDELDKMFSINVNGEIKNKGRSLVSRLTENFIYIRLTGEDYRHNRGNICKNN